MKLLWLAPLVQDSRGRWAPAMEAIRESAVGSFPCTWVSTRGPRARPWAVGSADVNAAQLAAIQADTRIRAVVEANYARPLRLANGALDAFLVDAEVEPVKGEETVRELVHRMAQAARPGHPALPDIEARLDHEIAAYAKTREAQL